MIRALAASLLLLVAGAASADDMSETIRSWNRPFPPFRIVSNLYYVGTVELASFLLTTSDGLILVDSGVEPGGEQIAANIRALGFRPEALRLIVNTQAHFDHASGFAALKKMSGARLAASALDADLLERGGKDDFALGDTGLVPPVSVDVRVKDGQALSVGDVSLVARMTPGHTEGTTTWLTTVKDAGKELRVVFPASTTVNPGVRIEGNPKYPTMLADFERTFSVLETLPCDVFLGQHAGFFGLAEKRAKLVVGAPNPFVDPEGCRQAIAGMEARFRKELADQRAER